jgi:UDP-glucose 4-epimerase
MKVLVTGATGFLGRAIVAEFSKNGAEVYTTAKSLQSGDLPNFRAADITVSESIRNLEKFGRLDAVVHSAGLAHQFGETKNEAFRRVNVEGTRHIAKLAIKLKAEKFILISSVSVYGAATQKRHTAKFEEYLDCQPAGFYAESKFESEKVAREICASGAMDLKILRPSTIIGENDRGNVARLIRAIDAGRFIWIGRGKNLKSLVYKADVARACLSVIESSKATDDKKTEIYNVTAEPVTMREIVDEIAKALKKSVPPIHLPAMPLRKSLSFLGKMSGVKKIEKVAETIEKWTSDDIFSGEKIREEIGFQTVSNPSEGIRREVLYYRNQK